MTMQKLRGIRNTGAYTAQRNMLEHLLRIEEEIVRGIGAIEVKPTKDIKKEVIEIIQQYKKQEKIHRSFEIQDIQKYFLITTGQEREWGERLKRGIYTSALIEQTEGDTPITIDLEGKKFPGLFNGLNTSRSLTIKNVKGDRIGMYAGSYQETANLTFKNIIGNGTGDSIGTYGGNARVFFQDITGHETGIFMGSNTGEVYAIFQNISGEMTGSHFQNSTVVAYNIAGKEQFRDHSGKLILKNPHRALRIEGVTDKQRADILTFIEQNAPPEDIMAYLVKNT